MNTAVMKMKPEINSSRQLLKKIGKSNIYYNLRTVRNKKTSKGFNEENIKSKVKMLAAMIEMEHL